MLENDLKPEGERVDRRRFLQWLSRKEHCLATNPEKMQVYTF
jgi:hypothetical protein